MQVKRVIAASLLTHSLVRGAAWCQPSRRRGQTSKTKHSMQAATQPKSKQRQKKQKTQRTRKRKKRKTQKKRKKRKRKTCSRSASLIARRVCAEGGAVGHSNTGIHADAALDRDSGAVKSSKVWVELHPNAPTNNY